MKASTGSMTNASGSSICSNGGGGGQFGDTALTKVFVGGLAWETPKEAMRDHFQQFGDILEAVIISDKLTGRSKGYGFVTFKDADAAKKACEEAAPVINGRRANCNLASLGSRRRRPAVAPPPPSQGPRSTSPAPANHVQWYYPPSSPYHHPAVPFYGYSPTYGSYSHKLGYSGGSYMSGGGHFSAQGHAMVGASPLMPPMYPLYHFHHQPHHQTQTTMGLVFPVTTPSPMATGPAHFTKTTSIASPNSVCLAVE